MRFWGGTAFLDTTEVVDVVRALDEAGFHGAMISDHLCFPKQLASPYPYTESGAPMWTPQTHWPDTWVLLGAMISATSRLRFSNQVLVAPNRPLLALAKSVGTAGALSDGRFDLGVGAGWMREEFDVMGVPFAGRGRRLDEMIDALRALLQPGWVEWHGEHYDVPPMTLAPAPPAVPRIFCGGHSDAALRRCARRCDGWLGLGATWAETEHHIRRLRAFLVEEGRADDAFEIIVPMYPQEPFETFRRAEDELGVTAISTMPWMRVAPDVAGADRPTRIARYVEAIDRFAEEHITPSR